MSSTETDIAGKKDESGAGDSNGKDTVGADLQKQNKAVDGYCCGGSVRLIALSLLGVLLGVGGAMWRTKTADPLYEAGVTLEVVALPVDATVAGSGQEARLGVSEEIGMVIDSFREPSVLLRAARNVHEDRGALAAKEKTEVDEQEVQWLANQVRVTRRRDSRYFDLRVRLSDPEQAKALLQATILEQRLQEREYQKTRHEKASSRLKVGLTGLEQQLARLEEIVAVYRGRILPEGVEEQVGMDIFALIEERVRRYPAEVDYWKGQRAALQAESGGAEPLKGYLEDRVRALLAKQGKLQAQRSQLSDAAYALEATSNQQVPHTLERFTLQVSVDPVWPKMPQLAIRYGLLGGFAALVLLLLLDMRVGRSRDSR